jgi:hypothetical protein
MTDLIERYLLLGLRLGRHVDGLVDAYYGPEALSAAVAEEEPLQPEELAAEAESLTAAVQDAPELETQRRAWLVDQVGGLQVYARVLAGDAISYSDEVRGCFGVEPTAWSEDDYRAAHARLDELLPPGESLAERYVAWRDSNAASAERMVPALVALVTVLRSRARGVVDLPEGEELTIEEVHDEPWWAFNYYLGRLHSRVVVNSDVPTAAADLVGLAAHEVYPGHHTERCVKEQLLVCDRGWLEETILLVPTPQSVVCEGIAETGLDVLRDEDLTAELERVLAVQGMPTDLARAFEVDRARAPLRRIGVDAALIIHEHRGSVEDAVEHVRHWALRTEDEARRSVRFATDPTWRAYAICYSAGLQLCERYVAGDPARFRTLLTEQVRVADLLAGAA